jgi:hypothetical protein
MLFAITACCMPHADINATLVIICNLLVAEPNHCTAYIQLCVYHNCGVPSTNGQ